MVFDVNYAFLEMTGCEREDVIGRESPTIDPGVNYSECENPAASLRKHKKCRDFRAKFRRRNGEIFSRPLSVATIEIDGVSFAISVLRDNSDAEAATQRLSAAAEALCLSEARYRTAFQTSQRRRSNRHAKPAGVPGAVREGE